MHLCTVANSIAAFMESLYMQVIQPNPQMKLSSHTRSTKTHLLQESSGHSPTDLTTMVLGLWDAV